MQIDIQNPVIVRLAELQGNQSDKQFAKRWLSVSDTTWFRVRTGAYSAADHTAAYEKLCTDLARIEDHLVITEGTPMEIQQLLYIQTGLVAVRSAFGETRNRLVIGLAQTGGGKTSLAQAIKEEFPAACASAQASEPWRTSYIAALQSIADACNIGTLKPSARKAETQLLDYLKKNPRIIVIDEGNYFGPETLNLVKLILNLTKSTVVILALPKFWETLKTTAHQEYQQLRNRIRAKFNLDDVDHNGASMLITPILGNLWSDLPAKDRKDNTARIVKEAKTFGLWNTVVFIATEIRAEAAGNSITQAIIDKAILNVRALRD